MRVFVAGATGVLGRMLLPSLVASGHDVIGLGRTPKKLLESRTSPRTGVVQIEEGVIRVMNSHSFSGFAVRRCHPLVSSEAAP
jgi:uncharacterized protein YbjT (DUF2867 family)